MKPSISKLDHEAFAKKVEELGVFLERFDHTPTSARIVAFLLLAEPNYQDFESIRAFLQASKSNISNTLTMLTTKGLVDYLTLPGDRKRYFKVNPDSWLQLTLSSIDSFTALKGKLTEVLELRDGDTSVEFYAGIQRLYDFYGHLERHLALAVIDWKKKNQ